LRAAWAAVADRAKAWPEAKGTVPDKDEVEANEPANAEAKDEAEANEPANAEAKDETEANEPANAVANAEANEPANAEAQAKGTVPDKDEADANEPANAVAQATQSAGPPPPESSVAPAADLATTGRVTHTNAAGPIVSTVEQAATAKPPIRPIDLSRRMQPYANIDPNTPLLLEYDKAIRDLNKAIAPLNQKMMEHRDIQQYIDSVDKNEKSRLYHKIIDDQGAFQDHMNVTKSSRRMNEAENELNKALKAAEKAASPAITPTSTADQSRPNTGNTGTYLGGSRRHRKTRKHKPMKRRNTRRKTRKT
jgi:hypothetical protein